MVKLTDYKSKEKHYLLTSGFLWVVVLLALSSCKRNEGDYQAINKGESCVNCHSEMTGFSTYHDPKSIGCAACHLGNTQTDDKDKAHQGMILIPGNLSNAGQTCSTSQCHSSELDRIHKSLMTTNSGIISVDKYLFDEIHHTDSLFYMAHLGHSAADTHLKNLCATCHLGNDKKEYAVTEEKSRGGGCLACHLNYENGSKPNIHDNIHPQLNLNVDNTKCFGCHSRSGRISTNYEGWYEMIKPDFDVSGNANYRKLQDGRIFGKVPDDVHHQAGMLCIDCHLSQEIMGDGTIYKHEADAVKVQCSDCHKEGNTDKLTAVWDQSSVLDYALRGYTHSSDKVLVTQKDQLPLVNTYLDEKGNAYLISKISKKEHPITQTCKRDAVHDNVSCSMCHTAWAPSCIGCHTDYDPTYLNKDKTQGRWIEHIAEFGYEPPVIGVKKKGKSKEYAPAIPGMIMTLNQSKYSTETQNFAEKFVRWYAPNAAHTTTKTVRDCASCHSNPQALGYGKGALNYIITGNKAHWEFEPYYANVPQDGLPHDAWIGFLKDLNPKNTYSSHDYFYPLDLQEQKKMLQVGACLQCHGKDEAFVKRMTDGEYQKMVKNKSSKCVF